MQKFCRELKAFEADTRGNVTILSGLAITMLLAFASLGAEYGAGLLLQSENQRIADSAAFIAATYCGANSQCSTTTTLNTATAIAQNIGALNGIPAADVTPAIVTSPSGAIGRRSAADQGQHHQASDDHPDRRRAQLSLVDGAILWPDRRDGERFR